MYDKERGGSNLGEVKNVCEVSIKIKIFLNYF